MANPNNMTYDDIFTTYYSLFRADSDIPASTDTEYIVGMRLANEAINYWANYEGVYWRELYDTNQTDGSGTQTITTGVTTYNAPTNFREAGGFVRILDANGNTIQRYPRIEPSEAQFKGDNSSYAYFSSSPVYYSTGTASQTLTTVTGVGTTWTSAMVRMQFVFSTGETGTVITFTNSTSLELSISQTVASTTYQVVSRGYKLHLNPAPTSNLNGLRIEYIYYKNPTLFSTGTSTTEMANSLFIAHRILAMQFRAARNPYYSSALKDSENTIRLMQLDNNSGSWDNPPTMADNSSSSWGQ